MKKKTILLTLALSVSISLVGCNNKKNTAQAVENTVAATTVSENIVTEKTEEEPVKISEKEEPEIEDSDLISETDEFEYETIESEDGYKVTYNPEYFIYDDTEGEYEGKDSTYIRCIIDKENEYENYIDVSIVKDYTAKELIDGIAFQSETEATPTHIVFANGKEYDAYYCERYIADAFMISFYAIDGKDAPYLIEIGSHIYSDDDEYAYYVSGAMEEIFLRMELE